MYKDKAPVAGRGNILMPFSRVANIQAGGPRYHPDRHLLDGAAREKATELLAAEDFSRIIDRAPCAAGTRRPVKAAQDQTAPS